MRNESQITTSKGISKCCLHLSINIIFYVFFVGIFAK